MSQAIYLQKCQDHDGFGSLLHTHHGSSKPRGPSNQLRVSQRTRSRCFLASENPFWLWEPILLTQTSFSAHLQRLVAIKNCLEKKTSEFQSSVELLQ
jgi:hypothetical protein